MVHTNKDGTLTGLATCSICKNKKPLSDFYKKKTTKHGYKSSCKECERILRKDYYSKNKGKEDLNHKKYVEKNKQNVNKKRNQRYYEIHSQKRAVANTYLKKKLSNPKERVYEFALKYINRYKKSTTKSVLLLGCDKVFFATHLEFYFNKDMDWTNYGIGKGKWSMDHIFPINSFNLSLESEEKECFNYLNIRPMWFNDNASKKDKI